MKPSVFEIDNFNPYVGWTKETNCLLQVEIVSDDDDDEEEDVITLPDDKYRPQSLEKMIGLIAMLVEKSRGEDNNLQLSTKDFNAVVGGGKVRGVHCFSVFSFSFCF